MSGGGFAGGSPVTGYIFSTPITLGTAVADAAGRVTLNVTIPATLAPGLHTVELVGADPNGNERVLASPITVASTGGGTAFTGSNTGRDAALGILVIGFGALLLLMTRRRGWPPGLYPERWL